MSKKVVLRKLNAVVQDFSPPMLDRSLLQQILTSASSRDDPRTVHSPIRKRRTHPSILDAHFYELAKILLPDPSTVDPKPTLERLSLQAIAGQLKSQTGVSVSPSTLKRYLDNHRTVKSLIQ
jgi:hypothetical protein